MQRACDAGGARRTPGVLVLLVEGVFSVSGAARAGRWPCGGIYVALELWPQGERPVWSPLPGGLAVPLGLGLGASGHIVKAVWELRQAQAGVKSVT